MSLTDNVEESITSTDVGKKGISQSLPKKNFLFKRRNVVINLLVLRVHLSLGQLCPPHAGRPAHSLEASNIHTGNHSDCQELQLDVMKGEKMYIFNYVLS